MDSSFVLGIFVIDVEVYDVGNLDIILGLSWLTENEFSVNMQDRWLRNVCPDLVIPYLVRRIASVYSMQEEQLEDGMRLRIIGGSKQYFYYISCHSVELVGRLNKHKAWDH